MQEQRKLAAIVAADVVGYSRLMGKDEGGTLVALKSLRAEVIDPKIAAHNGRVVKTTGDGLLLEFPSVVGAVTCVVAIQTEMAARSAEMAEERRIAFRVGVNVGDVIVDGDDIFGDGVNVAARLETLSEPGGACLSEDVVRQVRGKVDASFHSLGPQALKNIAEPVLAWRWSPLAATAKVPTAPALSLPAKPSIAVLPFQNMSGDPEQEYFADGIVEDIITALSRTRQLFVIARNSSFTYKGKVVDIKQVGRELGVSYVLEGSLRKASGRLRITGQLIDASTGAHIWADRFEGRIEDVFELQDQVASQVVACMMPDLERAEIDHSRRKPTTSLQAYDHFLRGRESFMRYTNEANNESLVSFLKASELDPTFGLALAYASSCYAQRKSWGWPTESPAEDAKEAERLAQRALDLDRTDPRILALVGWVFQMLCGRHAEGQALAASSVEHDPNYFIGWNLRGWTSLAMGNPEALQYFLQALRLSPLHPLQFGVQFGVAASHFVLKDYDEAIAWTSKTLAKHSSQLSAICVRAAALALTSRVGEARDDLKAIQRINPSMSIAAVPYVFPVARQEILDNLKRGLRLAGMPD